jgi:serine/threonine protein kinase
MTRSAVNESAAWLVKQLTTARVFDSAQISPYLAEFKGQNRSGNARELADFLLDQHLLTSYQIERVFAGEASRLVLGPYLLANPLGSGSLGNVFQAVGRSDRKLYAIKVLPLRSLWNVKLAKVQVQACAKLLAHSSIVPFVDIDSTGGFHYLVWPYVEGASLAQRVNNRGPATVPTALALMSQVAEGLSICHNSGIAHGLVNPSNLSINSEGLVRLLDLGVGAILSENIAEEESMLDTMSAANATLGMLDCCAPETLNSPTLRDPTSDQYSYGCVFYYILTGRLPFAEGNVVDRVLAHQITPPPSARATNPDVPLWLDEMIQRMMSKTPSRRFASMQEVLGRLLSGANEDQPPAAEVALLESTIIGAAAAIKPTTPPREPAVPSPAKVRRDKPSVATKTTETNTRQPTTNTPKTPAREGSDAVIDFSQYPTPDQESVSQHSPQSSTPIELERGEPLELQAAPSVIKPILIPMPSPTESLRPVEKKPKRTRIPANLPAPIVYTDSGKLPSVDLEQPIPSQPPVLPSFTQSWWYRLKSWFRSMSQQSTDVVQISVFGPNAISPGDNIKIQVFAHLPDSFESVVTLTKAFSHDATLLSTGYVDKPVIRGQELSFHLKIANAGVSPSLLTWNWSGQPQQKAFQIHVPWESRAGQNPAVLSVGQAGVVVGQLSVVLDILARRG